MTSKIDLPNLPRIEDISRRTLITSAFATALLIACGDDEPEEPVATTRTVQTIMGPVDIPTRLQRVVCLSSRGCLDVLDDLAAPLVATQHRNGGGVWERLTPKTQALPAIGIRPEIDFEAIVAAQPDLLLVPRTTRRRSTAGSAP